MLKNKRGQSTLEYIILMTAVVVAIIAFVISPNSPFKTALNDTLKGGMNAMNVQGAKIGTVFESSPAAP